MARLQSRRSVSPAAQAEGVACPRPACSTLVVELDAVQTAWVDALAELHGCDRASVLCQALSWFSARESARVTRTKRYRAIQLACRAEQWDPLSDHLAGLEVEAV